MRKFLKTKNFGSLKIMVAAALFAAISIVCGKFLALSLGDTVRISFENLPIILSGILFGPTVGAVTGLVADIIGCILRGYAINPIITVASAFIGFAAGAVFGLTLKKNIHLRLLLTVCICHAIGSVIIKTVGLSIILGYPFFITLAGRIVNYIIVGIAEFAVLEILFKNKTLIKTLGVYNEL